MVIPSPPGFGTPLATEEIGGAHYQRVQLSTGSAGQPVNDDNPLPIRADHETPFGEIYVSKSNPVIHANPAYNLIPANWRTYTATGGSAECTGKEFICQTGTSVGGYGVIRSLRSVNYHPSHGVIGRFAARFTTGVALSQQGVGFFNIGDGYLFGWSDEDGTNKFGIIHQYGGKPEVRTITVTVASGGSTDLTLTLNSVNYTIPLTTGSTAHNCYEITEWLNANQSVWSAKQNDSNVVLMALTDGAKSGTYTYSHATSTGSIAQTTAGVTKTTSFIAQADWNLNDLSSWTTSFDSTKGQCYSIQYHDMRYGLVEFFVMDETSGRYIPVHRMTFNNLGTSINLNNPSMRIGVYNASLGSSGTNLVTAAGCMSGIQAGDSAPIRNPRGDANTVANVTTTLTNILTVRCKEVYGGEPNQIEIEPRLLTARTETSKGATLVIYTNATFSGETNYTDLAANLVSETEKTSNTVSAGTPIAQFAVTSGAPLQVDLTKLNIRIPPTIYLTIAMKVNAGAAADCSATLTWYEDV